ncbi:hypothetical protein J7E81_12285 [Bacillus sp. ISL-18]|uniref:hypothetical protein n=1 Tax=Bacillus sp. ISL-18 TaxID=2819118 RepID=UPI001BE8DDC0|nr:hypothetical protein [Bacillus sp. ISL-18]
MFYRDNQNVLLLGNARCLRAEDLIKEVDDLLEDVYVGDTDFTQKLNYVKYKFDVIKYTK